MAPSRVGTDNMDLDGKSKNDRRADRGGRDSKDLQQEERPDGPRDKRKRKNNDSHDQDTPPKRPKRHSPSPHRSKDRRDLEPDRRERPPPTAPAAHRGGRGRDDRNARRGQYDGRQNGYGRDYDDEMEDVKHEPVSQNPISRVSASWIPDIEVEDDDELLKEVQAVMGFAGFKSTQNRKVPGNSRLYGIRKEKETKYRQYMNRQQGFNRPLSPSRD